MKTLSAIACCLTLSTFSFAQETGKPMAAPSHSKNIISYDFLSPLYGKATLSYERILAKGYLGLRLPMSYGFGGGELGLNTKWETGLEVKIYPTGQGKVKYFFGVEGKVGRMNYWRNNCPTCYYILEDQLIYQPPRDYIGIYAKNGIVYNPYKHIGFNAALGLGLYQEFSPYSFRNLTEHGFFEFGINYRF